MRIKMNDNREIFEVPGVYENPRRQTPKNGLDSLCKIYKMEKKRQQNFATGNAIYLLPRTIIQIANDNCLFRKEM
jgi:hypothetical protein